MMKNYKINKINKRRQSRFFTDPANEMQNGRCWRKLLSVINNNVTQRYVHVRRYVRHSSTTSFGMQMKNEIMRQTKNIQSAEPVEVHVNIGPGWGPCEYRRFNFLRCCLERRAVLNAMSRVRPCHHEDTLREALCAEGWRSRWRLPI